jgi:cytochrome oxidase assembly protein ShyY1
LQADFPIVRLRLHIPSSPKLSGFADVFQTFFMAYAVQHPALLVLLALGFWQLDRLAWKTELINNFNARANAPGYFAA